MILLFLGSYQATLAVMLSLPLSLVGAFVCLKALGQSLNVMTLGGLALSVGVLVDNAIVVIEVIMQKRTQGLSPMDASIVGASEVAMPVLASTVATLIVFFPVLFLTGDVRILFSALSIAVIAAMVASYFSAMMVIPLFTSRFLKDSGRASNRVLKSIQDWISRTTDAYGRSLAWVVGRRRRILPVAFIALLLVGGLLVGHIGVELFPRADAGSFRIDLRGPTGYRIEQSSDLAKKVEAKLREWIPAHDLSMIIMNAGVYYGYPAAFTPNSGTQDIFFNVEMTENREHTSQYYAKIIRERLPKEFPTVEFSIELGGLLSSALNGGLVAPIDVQIQGIDRSRAHEIAVNLATEFKKIRGSVDIRVQQRFDSPQISLDIHRGKASELGLTPDVIVKNVVSAVANSSTYSPSIWIDPKTGIDYLFGVQMAEGSVTSLDQLLNIPITSPQQSRSVPLRWVASATTTKGLSEINHKNLVPVIDIYMDAQDRDIFGVSKDAEKIIAKAKLPAGYSAEVRGEVSELRKSVAALGGGFLLAAVLVFLILVTQFRSFILPAIIMTTVPMGMVGVIVILVAWPTYFSIQAAIGCIFVIGVAVSHGVLLLEYIIERSHIDGNIDDAIINGAKARLRPIFMTSLASILGLVPMALGLGHGAEANIPLGRAVIGGQILSTMLNFYLVPALFRWVYSLSEKRSESAKEG
jgi:multidrug efflux pump subunit AcrB